MYKHFGFPKEGKESIEQRQKYFLLKEIHENQEGKEENMNIREDEKKFSIEKTITVDQPKDLRFVCQHPSTLVK